MQVLALYQSALSHCCCQNGRVFLEFRKGQAICVGLDLYISGLIAKNERHALTRKRCCHTHNFFLPYKFIFSIHKSTG